nr:hypothetical protein CFP56_45102 [Quercus suber]
MLPWDCGSVTYGGNCMMNFVTSSSPIGAKLLADSTPNSITKTLERYQESCFTPWDNSIEREAQLLDFCTG